MVLPGAKTVALTLQIAPKVAARLDVAAKAAGMPTNIYARLLFEAAYAARVGIDRGMPVDDAELDEQVHLVFALAGQADIQAIALATGVKPALVERILAALSVFRRRAS